MNRPFDDLSDAELLALAREGDGPAYGVLFKRHWHAARAMAASVTSRFEADDLASEAFARILKAVEKGNGPKTGFRSYLATTIRNVAIDWSRRKSTPNIEDADAIEDWTYSEVTALERIERETMVKAFYDLPDSWQEVLWYTEVEDMAPREVAPLLGITPNAVSALAARAREGLRQSWINAHLAEAPSEEPEHAWVLSKLGSRTRGKLSRTDRLKVRHHLEHCPTCADAAEEADRVGSRLAMGILPLFLGVSGAIAYTAWAAGRSGEATAAGLGGVSSSVPSATAHVAQTGAVHVARGAGRLRHLLAVGASASNSGVAAVAAVVAAAVVTTSAIVGAPQSSNADGQSTSEPGSPAADGRPGDDSLPDAPKDPGADGPAQESDPEGAPAPPSVPVRSPGPGDRPGLPDASADAGADAGDGAGDGADAAPPSPREDGCEAAIRLIPAEQTVFGYRLDDPAGSTSATDLVHGLSGRYTGSPGSPGWTLADTTLRPPTDEFTVQIRFRSSVGGGRMIGFSSATEGDSPDFDRHLFLTDDGRVAFGVWPGTVRVITSARSYLDHAWHQATATLSAEGMKLYVDGELVAEEPSVIRAQDFSGYWRIGYESMFHWGPEGPANWVFGGALTHAAVYRVALSPAQIAAQWLRCGG